MTAIIVSIIVGGIVILGVVIGARWLEARRWRGSLVAYRLRLPAKLTVYDVARWLGMVAASTHPPKWSLLPSPPFRFRRLCMLRGACFVLKLFAQRDGCLYEQGRVYLPSVLALDSDSPLLHLTSSCPPRVDASILFSNME